jgi:hypothetical protein
VQIVPFGNSERLLLCSNSRRVRQTGHLRRHISRQRSPKIASQILPAVDIERLNLRMAGYAGRGDFLGGLPSMDEVAVAVLALVQLDHLTTRDKYSRIATDLVVRRLNRPAELVLRHKDSLTSWLRTLHQAWFDDKNAKRASKRAARGAEAEKILGPLQGTHRYHMDSLNDATLQPRVVNGVSDTMAQLRDRLVAEKIFFPVVRARVRTVAATRARATTATANGTDPTTGTAVLQVPRAQPPASFSAFFSRVNTDDLGAPPPTAPANARPPLPTLIDDEE